jgi:hypothetical protein
MMRYLSPTTNIKQITYNWKPYPISFDSSRNPKPLIIILEKYNYRYIARKRYAKIIISHQKLL